VGEIVAHFGPGKTDSPVQAGRGELNQVVNQTTERSVSQTFMLGRTVPSTCIGSC